MDTVVSDVFIRQGTRLAEEDVMGIGRIQADTLNLHTILENRLGMVWNQLPFML